MKLNIIGGGPAGLYFAILLKRLDAAHEIEVFERNAPDSTFGWGVVFSGRTMSNLREAYRPEGFNLGMNLGRVAGAGVAGHVHLHALPRWAGDANFMSVVGETRVLPEDLPTTYTKLRELF